MRQLPRFLTWAALAAPVFFLLAAGDLALRSREALQEAKRYEFWRDNPAAKADWLNNAGVGRQPGTGREAVLRTAEKEFLMSESSAKMAYIWYKTAAEDFRLPFNPWAGEARKRLPAALAAWRAELAADNIKAEPWMTE